jgi:hypothetical protein
VKWAKDGKDYLTLPGKSSTTEIRELERVTSKLRIGDATQVNKAQIILSLFFINTFGLSMSLLTDFKHQIYCSDLPALLMVRNFCQSNLPANPVQTTEIRELERVTSKLPIGDSTQVNKAQIMF